VITIAWSAPIGLLDALAAETAPAVPVSVSNATAAPAAATPAAQRKRAERAG
jgi:hypothetical protein